MAVRAGRPSSGSGGLEAYAIPIFGLMLMGWIVRRLGPLLAARISRLLVGEETPLDFANTGKLKGKGKRATKVTPASAPLRSPPAKRPNGGSTTSGAALSVAQAEVAPTPAPAKATGSASYQDLALAEAPLAATQDEEAMATAKAREASVEWTVHEKKPKSGGGAKQTSPRAEALSSPSSPPPEVELRQLRFEMDEEVLRRIAHGLVTHEARVEQGDWKGISAGDYFVAYSALREVTIEVKGLSRHASFGAAWAALGGCLVPAKLGLKTAQHADEFYAQRFPRADLAPGVIAFELQVIFCEEIGGAVPSAGGGCSSDGAGASSSSADACAPPPSASPPRPENGSGGSGKGKAPLEPPEGASGKGKGKAPLEQPEGGAGKGKAPYRRPGKGPAAAASTNGKAPAGKAPRESD